MSIYLSSQINFIRFKVFRNKNISFNVSFIRKVKLLILMILFACKTHAIQYEEYMILHNANRCMNYFEYFEEKYKIPKHLLRSISTIESGRWNQKAGLYLPWPWAVNQGGKAYYYSTKEEAIEGVKSMLARGITNIDIGCMQINLHHHPEAFNNLNQAFEPKDNIEYASNFLRNNYESFSSWKKAVAAYHSLSELGINYASKVYNIFLKYRNGTLALNHCTSIQGTLVPCNGTTITKGTKFKLDKLKNNQPRFQKAISNNTKKDPKRLKSTMVLYSSVQEVN